LAAANEETSSDGATQRDHLGVSMEKFVSNDP
jgi:hypothetical protein